MANPSIPVVAPGGPVPPPVLQLPWGQVGPGGQVMLTASAYEFLQLLWSALQGGSGVIDLTAAGFPAPGIMQAMAGGLIAQDGRQAALVAGVVAQLAAVLQQPLPFGVTFTCRDISSFPVSTVVARAPAGIAWDMPVGLFRSTGKVTGGPIADTAFDLQVDGASVGTATWLSGSTVATFTKAAQSIVRETDYLDLVTPASFHGMAGAFGLTIMGSQH